VILFTKLSRTEDPWSANCKLRIEFFAFGGYVMY